MKMVTAKRTALITLILSVFMACTVMAFETRTVTTDMNFRTGPGSGYELIGGIPAGASVTYYNSESGWDRVSYNGQTGYIHGGNLSPSQSSSNSANGETKYVKVSYGYLTLRDTPLTLDTNEIGRLYTGESVQVQNYGNGTYWYVYSNKLGKYGYVNSNYLVDYISPDPSPSGTKMYVSVNGYLALRNYPSYNAGNEIGRLYSGESVLVQDTSGSTYWYVYSTKLGMYGYVNKDYLTYSASYSSSGNSSSGSSNSSSSSKVTYTVSVNGYLALRNYPSYDASNEIGKMYTGDTVNVIDKSGSTYWYVYSPRLGLSGYTNKDYLY